MPQLESFYLMRNYFLGFSPPTAGLIFQTAQETISILVEYVSHHLQEKSFSALAN